MSKKHITRACGAAIMSAADLEIIPTAVTHILHIELYGAQRYSRLSSEGAALVEAMIASTICDAATAIGGEASAVRHRLGHCEKSMRRRVGR